MNQAQGAVPSAKKRRKRSVGRSLLLPLAIGLLFYFSLSNFSVPTGSMEATVMAGDYLIVNKSAYQLSTPRTMPIFGFEVPWVPLLPAWNEPERGDLIVFEYPGHRDQLKSNDFVYYLKRCVAVAGDTLQLRNNIVYVNGSRVNLPPHAIRQDHARTAISHLLFPHGTEWTPTEYGPLTIPAEGDIINLDLDPQTISWWKVFIAREGHAVNIDYAKRTWIIDGKATRSYTVERDYLFAMGDNRDNSLDSRYWGFVPVENVVGSPLMIYYSEDPLTGEIRSERILHPVD